MVGFSGQAGWRTGHGRWGNSAFAEFDRSFADLVKPRCRSSGQPGPAADVMFCGLLLQEGDSRACRTGTATAVDQAWG